MKKILILLLILISLRTYSMAQTYESIYSGIELDEGITLARKTFSNIIY